MPALCLLKRVECIVHSRNRCSDYRLSVMKPTRKSQSTLTRLLLSALFVSVFFFAVQPRVSAQTAPVSRGFVVVNGGYQLTSNDFSDSAVKRENAEDGRFDTKYAVGRGVAFDVAAGGIVWRRLGVGVGVSRFSVATPASLSATVPHPFFFNQPRSVNGEATGLKREEMAIHIQVRGVLPVGDQLQVMVFGGPSFFQITQGVVTDFSYTDSYPYDAATFSAATTIDASVSKLGFHVGGDVAFFFTKQVGIGATVQFAGASVLLPTADGATQSVKVGGGRVGGGLRFRF